MILITAKVHPLLLTAFAAKGWTCSYQPDISREGLLQFIGDAEGLVVTTRLSIDREVINRAGKLKWIGRLGSGMEMIDTGYAAEKNIRCISSPEGNCQAVAEHALGMLLSQLNNLCKSAEEVKQGRWLRNENRGTELSGKVVGIIGYGHTGKAFAQLLQAFGCSILVYDKYKNDFGDKHIREASLEQICRYAQVISFHVPLTAETHHMANATFFGSLAEKPFIINTSRGPVLETAALCQALQYQQIAGAALDVLENEDLLSYEAEEKAILDNLLQDDRVMITPHIAGYSVEAFEKMAKVLLQKIG
jgi:D-3-phosphoglycerate dehydrogenase